MQCRLPLIAVPAQCAGDISAVRIIIQHTADLEGFAEHRLPVRCFRIVIGKRHADNFNGKSKTEALVRIEDLVLTQRRIGFLTAVRGGCGCYDDAQKREQSDQPKSRF